MAEQVRLKGKVKWANGLFDLKTLKSPDGKEDTFWSVTFYPEDKELDVIYDLQAQGVKNTIRRDEGGFHINYKRPKQKKMRGEVVEFDPPKVTDVNGNPWDKTQMIGNGSEAIINLAVYSHQIPGSTRKAKAVRLDGVQITNLVNYDTSGGGVDQPVG